MHGARSIIRFADKRDDAMGRWLRALIQRRGKVKGIVALANKLCRIGWHIISTQEAFDMKRAFQPAAGHKAAHYDVGYMSANRT
ncbi:MAG: hypothetical protein CENE_01007 [Candidatus Celerinatantimonas neptuna]|nr:MAG: hypothetical protein CENE_01007 [Candidatus Celerinatantimonas neptuna]